MSIPKSKNRHRFSTMVVHLLVFLALLGFTAIVILLGIVHYQSPFQPGSILYEISETKPWPTGTNFNHADWLKLKEAAQAINDASQEAVVKALTEYCFPPTRPAAAHWEAALNRHLRLQDGMGLDRELQVMLVLRMAFELPEDGQPWERLIHGSWAAVGSDVNSDGSVNMGWPLAWTNGVPFFCAQYEGYHGRPYDPVEEYRYLCKYYYMRDLSEVALR